jgi:hypothetical protein
MSESASLMVSLLNYPIISLLEICKQLIIVKNLSESTKEEFVVIFPIELGHYRILNLKHAMMVKEEMSNLCLKYYASRKGFDYAGFTKENLKVASSF